jgi:3-hydroxyacyl-CoA dehydrogenase
MGPAIASVAERAGHTVELFDSNDTGSPETFDSLVVPPDSSSTV